MLKKGVLIAMILGSFWRVSVGGALSKTDQTANKEESTMVFYQTRQHAWVVEKDGSQTEVVVYGQISKNKYWVREYRGSRQGRVKAKYMKPISKRKVKREYSK
ncbi:hypothetical protein BFP72_06350 [Reichenbachiella sp. 5M10]|uniref:hypothetical protein n=1 Tax=Reichenbachiella sp. 5M10 TaxID=1889772 RepID=UPI000C15A83C|nr:hypothetical protein [Reichenbachiella sp. 5M10]PIB35042.1 hypothetical protein BFP72_06350 [Reichenbachiella sp. 5M10]